MTLTRFSAGLLLAALGCFMAFLSMSRSYWLFLNPRFAWLTLAAGLALLLLGLALALERGRRVNLFACLALLVFLPLAFLAALQSEGGGFVPAGLSVTRVPDTGPSRIRLNGTEYIRLNPAELLLLADAPGGPDQRAFVTEGFVLRTPELDADGQVVLCRLVINCCFADALGVGIRLRVQAPSSLQPNTWIRAAGRLVSAPPIPGQPPAIPGVIATVVSDSAAFTPDSVLPVSTAEQPYVFEIRADEPFAN